MRIVPQEGSNVLALADQSVVELRQRVNVNAYATVLGFCQLKGNEIQLRPLAQVWVGGWGVGGEGG